jgi:hypothetical protein
MISFRGIKVMNGYSENRIYSIFQYYTTLKIIVTWSTYIVLEFRMELIRIE